MSRKAADKVERLVPGACTSLPPITAGADTRCTAVPAAPYSARADCRSAGMAGSDRPVGTCKRRQTAVKMRCTPVTRPATFAALQLFSRSIDRPLALATARDGGRAAHIDVLSLRGTDCPPAQARKSPMQRSIGSYLPAATALTAAAITAAPLLVSPAVLHSTAARRCRRCRHHGFSSRRWSAPRH